jgi:lipase chaperone LimK
VRAPQHHPLGWGLVLAGAGLAALLWWPHGAPPPAPTQAQAAITPAHVPAAPAPASSALPGAPRPATIEAANLPTGSLAGTDADGDWGPVDARGQLLPSHALRRRLDHHLSRVGELPLSDLRAGVQRQALAERGAHVAQQVMAVFDRYTALQQHAWTTTANPQQPSTWRAALQERQTVRRTHLGAAWAQAFYADEEAELAQWIAHHDSGLPLPAGPPLTAPLHPQAAAREAALQAQWRVWDERVSAARQTLDRLAQAPELSAPQRAQAREAALQRAFPDPHEQLRARALLGVN